MAGIPVDTIANPLNAEIKTAIKTPMMQASTLGTPFTISIAVAQLTSESCELIDRSKPPPIITIEKPVDKIPNTAICLNRLIPLSIVINPGAVNPK